VTADTAQRASDAIHFVLDGKRVSVTDPAPTMTVLEYLREVAHRTGTKEGCAEGDCGACTVVLGELDADGSRVNYRAVNSCIRFLPSIDGQELVTVESLQETDGSLHPVQRAMVDQHASQCGFCTPGFVMSLFALYLNNAAPTRAEVLSALSGNLCRCTGYRPIIDAGLSMQGYASPSHWNRHASSAPERADALRSVQRSSALRLPGWHAPRSVDELAAAFEAQPDALLLAGGTDVGLWVTKQLRDLPPIIYIGDVAELKHWRREGNAIVIGAAVSLTSAWGAIVEAYPQLKELAERFGSPPVRNSGTLCGNLANGSPIGDSMPVLIAMGAGVQLRRGAHSRRVALEDFYLGYQCKDLVAGEFVAEVHVPLPQAEQWLSSYKLAKRIDQDISAVCAAFALQLEHGVVRSARIAYGGMAAVPARARACERVLIGAPWQLQSIDSAIAALAFDFQPLSDMRASSAYRLEAAGNLLRRFYFEHNGATPLLRTDEAATAAVR
jgi:xanthine dehydrogenase small subunit